ncbi:MAG: hypothetical protein ACLFM7_14135 [Bacteroidales bacterium]
MKTIINYLLIIWVVIWAYFAAFNWEVFIVGLNINLGFTVITGYPFLFYFFTGIIFLIVLRYIAQYLRERQTTHEKNLENRIAMQGKDIEILQLKEVLFNMQTKEYNQTAESMKSLNEKLNKISQQMQTGKQEYSEKEKETEAEEKAEEKNPDTGKKK